MMRNEFKVLVWLAGLMWLGSGAALAEEESFGSWLFSVSRQKEIRPVENQVYQEECGACHFAYQPGLLPAKSWARLLDEKALSDHFGENAELDKDTLKTIHDYTTGNAADTSYYKRSRKIALATEKEEALLRITEVRYIKRKHHEIPERMIKGNKDVKSLSYCDACHTKADKGIFDEDTVRIPNYPDWED